MRATFYGALAAAIAAIFAPSAEATLTFYYDPLTGNVSMDTTHTRSGSVYVYALSLGSMSFRSENLIRITNSTFLTQNSHALGEGSFSDPWSGLYTIGDVLPTGLTESEWSSLFTYNSGVARYRNEYLYTDVIGGGAPPPATFVYGRPEGEFQNASDLLDPDTLNWAETATLRYFPDTGNVTLQTAGRDGGYITAFMLESAGKFTPAAYDPAFRANVFSEVSDSRIAGIFSLLRPGSYRLGEILPAGMSQGELEDALGSAIFLGRAGFGARDLDIRAMGTRLAVQVVPEPATRALIGVLFAVGLLARRRAIVG